MSRRRPLQMLRLVAAGGLLLATGCGARTGLDDDSPPERTGPLTVQSIAVGNVHNCALLSDGTATCWGYDADGPARTTPAPISSPSDFVSITCTSYRTCGVQRDGTLQCWGTVARSDGTVDAVVVGTGFTAASAGWGYECGILAGGGVACRLDPAPQAYEGSIWNQLPTTPTPVAGLDDAVSIASGATTTCAVRASGAVACWGGGPLGDGTEGASLVPADVTGLPEAATQVAVGVAHACALLADGGVWCWGQYADALGSIGADPPMITSATGLTPVLVLSGAKEIAAGDSQTVAVLEDGSVRWWGTNFGAFQSATPAPFAGITAVVAVGAGEQHDCALLAGGRVGCWGNNMFGVLGDGTMSSSDAPVTVVGLP